MRFANMSPADRMKASGLIGLIVVILFFVVHTMLGTISPKQQAVPLNNPPSVGAPVPAPAPAADAGSAAPAPGEEFPTKAAAAKRTQDDNLNINIRDPFDPIRDPNDGRLTPSPDGRRKKGGEPRVALHEVSQYPPLDPMRKVGAVDPTGLLPMGPRSQRGSGGSLLGSLFGSPPGPTTGMPPAAVAVPPIEPEIRLIGVIEGDPSVATVQVAGHTLLVRPGDALAKGYRVMAISAEGIVIRHLGEWMTLRVGVGLNEPRSENKQ